MHGQEPQSEIRESLTDTGWYHHNLHTQILYRLQSVNCLYVQLRFKLKQLLKTMFSQCSSFTHHHVVSNLHVVSIDFVENQRRIFEKCSLSRTKNQHNSAKVVIHMICLLYAKTSAAIQSWSVNTTDWHWCWKRNNSQIKISQNNTKCKM